ncbi:Zinc finger CCCH domain-containing protein 34 [Linum grandiflorum]
MARLNPRDCWYWLSGSCLNPTCAFRHPPLENPTEVPSESGLVPSQATQPKNKNAVPCYFYFQGFCSKGDTCTFLHAPHGSMSTAKSIAPSTNSDGQAVNISQTSGNKSVLAPTEVQNNLPSTAQKPSGQSKGEVQQLVPDVEVQKSSPFQIAETDAEEACVYETDILLPPESYNEDSDLNSEDHADDYIEQEPWESSPGFDVLVDNEEEENVCYEDEQDYLVSLDREHRVADNQFMEYNIEEPDEYARLGFSQSRELDLRDHLRKRRAVDGEPLSRSMRRRESSLVYEPYHPYHLSRGSHDRGCEHGQREQNRRSHERRYKHEVSRRNDRQYEHGLSEGLRGRLVCDVGRTGFEFMNGNSASERGWMNHRERRREPRRPYVPSEFGGRPVRRSSEEFSRPKSLAQIREEKRRCQRNGYYIERDEDVSGTETNFEGPKPLNEILEEKRNLWKYDN